MSNPIIFDVETKHIFQEVGGDIKKLGVSIVGCYDYGNGAYETYLEDELNLLFKKMEHASLVIGFNSNKFDLKVLEPYYIGDIFQFSRLDILEEVEKYLGHRVALDDLAKATLDIRKSGHGFKAIEYYRKKEWDKLKSYVLDDVKITKELYEYGKKNKLLKFLTAKGLKDIIVDFSEHKISNSISLSLPF
jgi:DEAD/DEAH box helicase domain-containing protein